MFNILLIFLLLILIILSNNKTNENMTDNYNKFLNNKTSLIQKNDVFKSDESIEITLLPVCNKIITVDYGLNINTIINDGISIHQNINDPMIHTIEVDKKNYNLVKIEWRKTNFTYNKKPVGLTLHLLHNDYNMNRLNIIIPLDFITENINLEEGFKNIYYNKQKMK